MKNKNFEESMQRAYAQLDKAAYSYRNGNFEQLKYDVGYLNQLTQLIELEANNSKPVERHIIDAAVQNCIDQLKK